MDIIQGNKIARQICDALDLKNVRRIILDLPYDDVGKIYIEVLTDMRLYEIDFTKLKIEEKIDTINITTNEDGWEKHIKRER